MAYQYLQTSPHLLLLETSLEPLRRVALRAGAVELGGPVRVRVGAAPEGPPPGASAPPEWVLPEPGSGAGGPSKAEAEALAHALTGRSGVAEGADGLTAYAPVPLLRAAVVLSAPAARLADHFLQFVLLPAGLMALACLALPCSPHP